MQQVNTRGQPIARRVLQFGLATAVLMVIGAHTPWLVQRVPRFTVPILAAAGAVLIVLSLVSSLVQLVSPRASREETGRPLAAYGERYVL
jgi:uncharacterized membrane protein